jgi:hypothetical protein
MAMNVSNTWFSNIPVRFANRDYNVVHGHCPDGSAALFLRNIKTDALLPLTLASGVLPREANETLIVDDRGLIKSLEDAGIVEATSKVHTIENIRMRWCQVIHPELVRRAELNAHGRHGRDGGEHELAPDRENSRER